MDENSWIVRAAWYEVLAKSFLYPTQELAQALNDGEFSGALNEMVGLLNSKNSEVGTVILQFDFYKERSVEDILHELRREHTRLFIGSPNAIVSPYAGIWQAENKGLDPVFFVNKESMAVERFMRSCGVGQPKGTNEPLDHIGSEFEFLRYLSLLQAGAIVPPLDVAVPDNAYEQFYQEHILSWIPTFAEKLAVKATAPFFRDMAVLVRWFIAP
jgi:TorA maturation chaperone TorD